MLVGALLVWLSLRRILLHSTKNCPTWPKVTERIVLSLAALACAAVAASASFNVVSLLYFRAHNPPPGDTYLVAGHRMHMICTGSGSPTLVLDAGLGNDALVWGGGQPWLSRTTRVCAYDRAGFGWSDALPPPRDADHITSELHQLLLQANISGPIVLIGHSIAGIYIRDYATRFPTDVAGLVLVDSSTPLQNQDQALAELNVVQSQIAKQANEGVDLLAAVQPLEAKVVGPARRGLIFPLAAVILELSDWSDPLGAPSQSGWMASTSTRKL